MKSRDSIPLTFLVAFGFSACVPAANVAATPSAPMSATVATATSTTKPVASRDLYWARASAEHNAIYLEIFKAASDRLDQLSRGHAQGSWGVILDADETVLDNSEYEVGRVPFGGSYDPKGWTAWVMQGRAPALPGAVAFTTRVRQLGGRVVIVTNRDAAQCAVTRTNLQSVSIPADLVLCKTTTDDKNPRFDAVQAGTASAGFPPLTILEWVGDNIQDFPHLSQAILSQADSAYLKFGDVYFALPNAMYGSWQANPFR